MGASDWCKRCGNQGTWDFMGDLCIYCYEADTAKIIRGKEKEERDRVERVKKQIREVKRSGGGEVHRCPICMGRGTKKIEVRREVACSSCNGRGYTERLTETVSSSNMGHSGGEFDRYQTTRCRVCYGGVKTITEEEDVACMTCNGTGLVVM